MSAARTSALRFLRETSTAFVETLDPTGFRLLCNDGLLREEPHPTRYRFAVTRNGWRLRFGAKV
jgi:hypothetical protein